jgi:hypothetical protein
VRVVDNASYGIHLFHGTRLVANLRTAEGPQSSYLVDGGTYSVVSQHGPYLESDGDGAEAWDLQVEPS